jgi:hypothetical protein
MYPSLIVNSLFGGSALVWMLLIQLSLGQTSTVYVDFGVSSVQTPSPTASGDYWNNVTEQSGGGVPNLVTSTGLASGISLGISGVLQSNPFGTTVPDANALGGLAVETATKDWLFLSGDQVITVTLRNLSPEGIYRLSLFGSRDWAGTMGTDDEIRVTRYDVTGLTNQSNWLTTSAAGIGINPQLNANRSGLAVFDQIRSTEEGGLVITVRRHRGAFGYLGALRLETMNTFNGSPSAIGVAASGSPRIGSAITGRYTYWDAENDPESGSEYFWERSATPGATGTRIVEPSTTASTFIPTATELGLYIRMGVIPRSNVGRLKGATSYSRWMGPIASQATLTSFHIGSSFTLWPDIPRQLRDFGLASNRPIVPGVQLTSGQQLHFHWHNGLDGGGFGSGVPSRLELATGTWDILVLQPFNSEWFPGSVYSMREYAQKFYSLAAPHGTQVYLYCAWPWRSQSVATQSDINATFEDVRASISVGGAKPALVIPAGQALRACLEACGTGALTNYTREDFYRHRDDPTDNLHLSHLGSYVAALTHYATIFKTSPVGLPAQALDAGYINDNVVFFDPVVALQLQEIVWYVVRNYPHSGLGVTSFGGAPLTPPLPPPVVIPPPVVEADPPFVSESNTPSDPAVLALAFGTSPAGPLPLPENLPRALAVPPTGNFTVEFTVNPTAESEGVTYTPHWSYDLHRWTTTQPTNTGISRTGDKMRITWPKTSRWRFMRIQVAKPAQ